MVLNMHEALSQSEIDALLNKTKPTENNDNLKQEEAEVLSELCNMSMGRVSDVLRSKINKKAVISSPVVQDANYSLAQDIPAELALMYEVQAKDAIKDKCYIVFNKKDTIAITEMLLGGETKEVEETELNEMQSNVIDQVVKEMMEEAFRSISLNLNKTITPGMPKQIEVGENLEKIDEINKSSKLVSVVYDFQLDEFESSKVVQLIPLSMAKKMVTFLLNSMEALSQEDTTESTHEPEPQVKASDKMAKAAHAAQVANAANAKQITVKPVAFPSFDEYKPPAFTSDSLEFILDVPLQLTVELGKTKKAVSEILALNVGSIVELDNLAEEHVNILVNGKLVARGEVIVIDENFGVRIMEVFTHNRNSALGIKR